MPGTNVSIKSSNETSVLYLFTALFRNDGVCAERRLEVVSESNLEDVVDVGGISLVVSV